MTQWFWFNPIATKWENVPETDNESLETEFQTHLDNQRRSQRVYHCFGNGWTTIVDFDQMKTTCGSGRCMGQHTTRFWPDDHLTFYLKRINLKGHVKVGPHFFSHDNEYIDPLLQQTTLKTIRQPCIIS